MSPCPHLPSLWSKPKTILQAGKEINKGWKNYQWTYESCKSGCKFAKLAVKAPVAGKLLAKKVAKGYDLNCRSFMPLGKEICQIKKKKKRPSVSGYTGRPQYDYEYYRGCMRLKDNSIAIITILAAIRVIIKITNLGPNGVGPEN